MKLQITGLFIVIFTIIAGAQFSEDIASGPAVNVSYCQGVSQLHMEYRVRIPGDYIDLETEMVTLSAILDKTGFETYGISWVSLLWIPPLLVGQKIAAFKAVAIVIMGINGVANANIGIRNSWIRATAGWNNDLFLCRDILWIFTPEVGCKLSFPQRWISDGSFRLCVDFPAMVGPRTEFIKNIKPFQPRISIGVDVLMMYAEFYLGGK